jgi:hypothetical protein
MSYRRTRDDPTGFALPIPCGIKGNPVDPRPLSRRAMQTLGRPVSMGERLTAPEMQALGFLIAARDIVWRPAD